MRKARMAKCKHTHCFAYMEGQCLALENAKKYVIIFPFYKTAEQLREERRKSAERIKRLGLTDKIRSKYGGIIDDLD